MIADGIVSSVKASSNTDWTSALHIANKPGIKKGLVLTFETSTLKQFKTIIPYRFYGILQAEYMDARFLASWI